MNPEDLFGALTVLVTQCFLISYAALLIDFREPRRTWKLRWGCALAVMAAVNVALILTCGYQEVYLKLGVITMTVPYVLLTIWASRRRGMRVGFGIATTLFLGCIGNVNGVAAFRLLGWPLVKPVMRALTFLLLYLLVRRVRAPYFQMLHDLEEGWTAICVQPLLAFMLLIYMTNVLLPVHPDVTILLMYGIVTLCACSYYVSYQFFRKAQGEYEMRSDREILAEQVQSLAVRLEAIRSAEETVRIERHDLRHRLQTVAGLIRKGDDAAALEFIGASEAQLESTKPERYCVNPILDAVLASYLSQAEREGIAVEHRLAIPETLPVDAAELATVLANAIENAIHACQALPGAERRIICRCVAQPRFMFEIANPYAGQIEFDPYGMPVTQKHGHGVGIRSITAFADKHGALCNCRAEHGWFRLQLSL